MTDLVPGSLLNCDDHGPKRWHHIICNECGAVFDLETPKGDPRAPDSCQGMCPACGVELLPSVSENFSARAVCAACAESVIERRGVAYCTRDPEWTRTDTRPTLPN